jgi:hypothetical protein
LLSNATCTATHRAEKDSAKTASPPKTPAIDESPAFVEAAAPAEPDAEPDSLSANRAIAQAYARVGLDTLTHKLETTWFQPLKPEM